MLEKISNIIEVTNKSDIFFYLKANRITEKRAGPCCSLCATSWIALCLMGLNYKNGS